MKFNMTGIILQIYFYQTKEKIEVPGKSFQAFYTKGENRHKCKICMIDSQRTSFAEHLKKRLENGNIIYSIF